MTEIIRILLVDDHMVVRKGIAHVLSTAPDIEVIGEAEDGEEAIYLSKKLKPDIIAMDVKMDGIGGVEATRMIMRHHSSVRVIGLSTYAQQDVIAAMFEAGAKGYLLKDVSADELSAAIRKVHGGGLVRPEAMQETEQQYQSVPVQSPEADPDISMELGEQQKKVLALMTKGFTNPEIAEKLGFSKSTARYHVSAILNKLDVSNRAEAVAMAIRHELVNAEDF